MPLQCLSEAGLTAPAPQHFGAHPGCETPDQFGLNARRLRRLGARPGRVVSEANPQLVGAGDALACPLRIARQPAGGCKQGRGYGDERPGFGQMANHRWQTRRLQGPFPRPLTIERGVAQPRSRRSAAIADARYEFSRVRGSSLKPRRSVLSRSANILEPLNRGLEEYIADGG